MLLYLNILNKIKFNVNLVKFMIKYLKKPFIKLTINIIINWFNMRKRIDQYVIDMNSCIGKGAFGEVYKGVVEKTNKEVAAKILFKKKSIFIWIQWNVKKIQDKLISLKLEL